MKANAILRLMRIENCAMAAVAVMIGFIVAGGTYSRLEGLVLAAVSAFLITGAGNMINDYFDLDIDRTNAPHRPIPAGEIGAKPALSLSVGIFWIGTLLALFINIACLLLAALNSLILYAYAKYLKGTILFGNLGVSYLTGSTFVYGGLVVGNPMVTFIMFLLAFLANMGREIIGDIEDIEGDRKAGIKTLAIKLGAGRSWVLGSVFIIGAVLLSPLPFVYRMLGVYYLPMVIAADAVFAVSILQMDARRNQSLTKIGIMLALAAFLAGALVT